MISVIITTYNRAWLLKRAVESVLNQSFRDFELIVVDDCSTDVTVRVTYETYIANQHLSGKCRYYRTIKNSGSDSLPKNLGIKEALGEYVVFLDDDDVYRKDALKVLYNYIKDSEADVVYGDYLMHEEKVKAGWSMDFSGPLLQKMNYIAMSVAIVKREALLEVGGFDEKVPKFKDWNLWLRLHKRGYRFLHVPIIITEVYPQKKSISEKYKVKYDEAGHYLPTYFDPVECKIYARKTMLGKEKKLKVAAFTLTKDRLDYTKRMIESTQLAGYPFDWFVVDQGSKDGTVEWLSGKTKAQLLNVENVGIAKGWDQAVELIKKTGKYDIIIKIDNDCEMLSKDWLKTMIGLWERSRKMVLSPYVEGLEDSPGGVLRQRKSGKTPYVLLNDQVLGIVPFLGGICWGAPVELYDDWKFEEESFYTGGKDFMISQYARNRGYPLFYVEELRLWHIDGTAGQKERYPDYFKLREKELTTKYGENG